MPEPEFTITRHGQLVHARVTRLTTREDVDAYGAAFGPELRVPGATSLCADHRGVRIYSPAAAERLVDLFLSLNRTWARAALVVLETNATLNIQLTRVLRASKNPGRRLFTDAVAAEAFLGEVLTVEERGKLRSLLRGTTAGSLPP